MTTPTDSTLMSAVPATTAQSQIDYLPIEALIPYARNSRTHDAAQVAQIAASIKAFGFTNPVLVDGVGGIIAGHGRVLAARQLNLQTVPCIRLSHLTENQTRAYVIADNQLALNAGWNQEMLLLEIQTLQAAEFNLDLLGFTPAELAALMPELVAPGLTDEDAVPEVRPDPVSQLGDVWLLGGHRVMCGDATSIEQLEQLTAGALVDMWLTDPPYNVAYEGGTKDKLTIQNDAMGNADFRQFLRDAYVGADAVMKSGAVFYIWHADSEGYNFRREPAISKFV